MRKSRESTEVKAKEVLLLRSKFLPDLADPGSGE
jgi:hypothetical protein